MNPHELHRLAGGRRIIHFCLFGWLGIITFRLSGTPLMFPLLLALSGAAMAGSARVTGFLAMTRWVRWACVLGAVVPMVGLLVMGWLSSKARKRLLAAGWRLGLFEAHAPKEGDRIHHEPAVPMGEDVR